MLYTLTEEEFKTYRLCRSCVKDLYNSLLKIYQENPEKMTPAMKEKLNIYKEALGLNNLNHPCYGV